MVVLWWCFGGDVVVLWWWSCYGGDDVNCKQAVVVRLKWFGKELKVEFDEFSKMKLQMKDSK